MGSSPDEARVGEFLAQSYKFISLSHSRKHIKKQVRKIKSISITYMCSCFYHVQTSVHITMYLKDQGCTLSPYLFNLYADYIMRNARLDEAQAGIKIARRNINNLRYADDTTLRAASEELKSLLVKVKEESEKVALKLNIQKRKIMASGPITLRQIDGETRETVTDYFLGLQKSLHMVTAAIKLKDACSLEEKL